MNGWNLVTENPGGPAKGRFQGRVALVTGAAGGQGKTHCERLAREGASIVAVDLPEPVDGERRMDMTVAAVEAAGGHIVTGRADVRDLATLTSVVAGAVSELGRLDIVVANAGVLPTPTAAGEVTEEAWSWSLEVNLSGVWHTCQATLPHLRRTGDGGAIVVVNSIFGLRAWPEVIGYVAAKHGTVGLVRGLALELAEERIRVNAVHPTTVNTPMLHALAPEGVSAEEHAAQLRGFNAIPVPWIEPADVSNAVAFLASDEARYITGASLPVDAGALLT